MPGHLVPNHFDVFQLPVAFDLNVAALDAAFHALQREVHPDRFAQASAAEQRAAAQRAVQVNEAYRTLRAPLGRGRHILQLHGIDTEEESNTAMPRDFLVRQMEWREAVAKARAARDAAALETLSAQAQAEEREAFQRLAAQLSRAETYADARDTVRQLRFLEKLGEDIAESQESVDG